MDFWEDQRKDPELAARAAARYLKDLHDRFNDWQLSLAAYNTGEGRIQKYVNKVPEGDFWSMRQSRRNLHRETREYVPAIMAAILLASNPKAYGIEVPPEAAPPAVATVTIETPTDLRVLAKAADVSLEALQDLNPSLRRIMTPPAQIRAEHSRRQPRRVPGEAGRRPGLGEGGRGHAHGGPGREPELAWPESTT